MFQPIGANLSRGRARDHAPSLPSAHHWRTMLWRLRSCWQPLLRCCPQSKVLPYDYRQLGVSRPFGSATMGEYANRFREHHPCAQVCRTRRDQPGLGIIFIEGSCSRA